MKRALVFPGQGAQVLGMGRAVAEAYPEARQVFEEVDDALSFNLSQIIWGDDQETLNLTVNAQPALMATSLAVLRVLVAEGFDIQKTAYFAGHSLGEYTALCAAQSMTLATTARLLRVRGEAMQAAVPVGEGGMAALLGLNIEVVEAIIKESAMTGICDIANDNDPKQVVISGSMAALDKAIEMAKEKGARRSVRLKTSAPFHCRLMQPAAERMAIELDPVTLAPPQIPVITNVTAQEIRDASDIKSQLISQITGRVRWRETVHYMHQKGVDTVLEIGAGNALSGMIRRTVPSIATAACASPEQVQSQIQEISNV